MVMVQVMSEYISMIKLPFQIGRDINGKDISDRSGYSVFSPLMMVKQLPLKQSTMIEMVLLQVISTFMNWLKLSKC